MLKLDWMPLRTVGEAHASVLPVGPPRKLNVAIAGVLGLFVGILLAFFVHYLQSESVRPEAPARSIPNEEGRT